VLATGARSTRCGARMESEQYPSGSRLRSQEKPEPEPAAVARCESRTASAINKSMFQVVCWRRQIPVEGPRVPTGNCVSSAAHRQRRACRGQPMLSTSQVSRLSKVPSEQTRARATSGLGCQACVWSGGCVGPVGGHQAPGLYFLQKTRAICESAGSAQAIGTRGQLSCSPRPCCVA
jgi:hypothetical protein